MYKHTIAPVCKLYFLSYLHNIVTLQSYLTKLMYSSFTYILKLCCKYYNSREN